MSDNGSYEWNESLDWSVGWSVPSVAAYTLVTVVTVVVSTCDCYALVSACGIFSLHVS